MSNLLDIDIYIINVRILPAIQIDKSIYRIHKSKKEEEMLVFVSIAITGTLFLIGSHIFGGGDEHEGAFDHDHDVHLDHDADHGEISDEPTISIFSMKVLSSFVTAFGAAGAIARHLDASYELASVIGVGVGVLAAGLMYGVMRILYSQQSTSILNPNTCIGQNGVVTTTISEKGMGEVSILVKGQSQTYFAYSKNGNLIQKGSSIIVVDVVGGKLYVEQK